MLLKRLGVLLNYVIYIVLRQRKRLYNEKSALSENV